MKTNKTHVALLVIAFALSFLFIFSARALVSHNVGVFGFINYVQDGAETHRAHEKLLNDAPGVLLSDDALPKGDGREQKSLGR